MLHKDLFIRHLLALRREVPFLRNSVFVVDVECDQPLSADLHETWLMQAQIEFPEMQNVCMLYEDGGHSGVRVASVGKQVMIEKFDEKLVQRQVKFMDYIVTAHQDELGQRSEWKEKKHQLIDQLRGFVWDERKATSAHGKARRTATGKIGGGNDDLVMAALHCYIATTLFNSRRGHQRYAEWHAIADDSNVQHASEFADSSTHPRNPRHHEHVELLSSELVRVARTYRPMIDMN